MVNDQIVNISMFNFTPPSVANRNLGGGHTSGNVSGGAHSRAYRLFLCLLVALLCLPSCTKKYADDGRFFVVDMDFYANADSLREYARRAYIEDDARALCLTAVAAYYFANDSAAHDTLPLISTDEADIMLLHSADLGYQGAYEFIYMLFRHDAWQHTLPIMKE